ncbi:MAG: diacylglycerol kinase family protein [bacterium]
MKVLFLVNPNAGGKGNADAVRTANRRFDKAGWTVSTVTTKNTDQAGDLIKSAPDEGFELLVIAGGDGTIHNTIQHLPIGSFDNPSKLPFAIIPLGSGNDFYRGTGAPRDASGAAENILNGQNVPIDIGIAVPLNEDGTSRNEKPERFCNTAGIGIDSQTLATRERSPSWLSARYELLFLMTLARLYPLDVTIRSENMSEKFDAYWILCCNNGYIGSGMKVAPEAKINDGLADVLIIRKQSKLRFVFNLPKVFQGTHTKLKGVEIIRTSELDLRCNPGQRLALDGDRSFDAPAKIKILPGAVCLRTNLKTLKPGHCFLQR